MNAVSQALTIDNETSEPTPQRPSQALASMTPMDMLDRAVSNNAGIDVIEKLMGLQERWESNQARKAFDNAMADARAEITPIVKNRQVGFDSKKAGASRTDYRHEDLAQVARTVDPVLAKHGLSYRFRTTSAPNEPISVTCIVSHRLGHSEENTLIAGRDDSGNKNSIQQIGSTITYLQRYSLKAALGLAASNDDDGKAADQPKDDGPITKDQVAVILKLIEETETDIEKFCQFGNIASVPEMPASQYQAAIDKLNAKKRSLAS